MIALGWKVAKSEEISSHGCIRPPGVKVRAEIVIIVVFVAVAVVCRLLCVVCRVLCGVLCGDVCVDGVGGREGGGEGRSGHTQRKTRTPQIGGGEQEPHR